MKRDSGYYWIKRIGKEWEVSYYYSKGFAWLTFNNIRWLDEKEIEFIHEVRLFPPENI